MNIKALVAAGALLATQSFAIIGIGGHYAPGFGTKMEGMSEPAPVTEDKTVSIMHNGFDGTMQGFGFKLWIDLLPIIDIEATMNFQMGSYDASLFVVNPNDPSIVTEVPLEIELGGTPFGKANPKFVAMTGDLSITYPITFLPIIRPYIGGGLSYHLNSFVLNQKFVSSVIDGTTQEMITVLAQVDPTDPNSIAVAEEKTKQLGETMKQKVQDAALDEGLKKSLGGHILVGVRAKLPIIPIAAYGNFKYYIGGDYPSEIDAGNMTVELGVGLAI
ncbi:hypothetical protein [Fibrobacter sp.]|uniref:hypothetical protein n=1 Tax=Fibrobacter sp. TaxID=35828 RepID=UPI002607F49B|nr:hypothetical protein [Fibrobacter sp.]MDD5941612.1 hypothetical protein [Fibrobacter sp.]